jgi:hypothetical protein
MKNKEKLRKLKNLMYKYPNINGMYPKEHIKRHKDKITEKDSKFSKKYVDKINDIYDIYSIADDLKMTEKELKIMWINMSKERQENKAEYKKKPLKEGRDNKDVLVGSGSSQRGWLRYPSKKRSLSTWKKFYKLFPQVAIEDGFDGKTSKKMK